MTIVDKAEQFANQKHRGQRYDNRPFIYHPTQTYSILRVVTPFDENLLAAAFLHDVMEDCHIAYPELKTVFNEDIANLVREVTKTTYNAFPYLKTHRGVLLKFADRLSNLSNMGIWDKQRQEKYIQKSKFWKS